MNCPECSTEVGEGKGSSVSPYLNTYRCPACDWTALRCGDSSCDGYLVSEQTSEPHTVRYNCTKCNWTGTGVRFAA